MSNEKIKTIFFGTPEFAVPALQTLAQNGRFEVVAVVTQPDRPVGRKKIITPPPVKITAESFGFPVFQPEKLKDEAVQDEILASKPELAVVVAYGNLIPKRMLAAVPRGFVNIHPSLLPKHRGASPLTATILAGDKETGVCLMVLDEAMDHGPVIACRPIPLDGTETTASLRTLLAPVGGEMISKDLVEYLDGKITPKEQNHDEATFCKLMEAPDFKIDWTKPAAEIERLIRAGQGLTPAWTTLDGATLLIHKAHVVDSKPSETAGILVKKDDTLAVAMPDGYLALDELQPSGGKQMSGQAFLNGHKAALGKTLN